MNQSTKPGSYETLIPLNPHTPNAMHAPISVDNHLMLVDAKGNYLAKVDASEPGWRQRIDAFVTAVNAHAELVTALRELLRVQAMREAGAIPKLSDWTNAHDTARKVLNSLPK